MSCPSSVLMNKTLTFTVDTHDPTTNAVTDADSVPSYRIYEEETTTPLWTGTMTKLDDANTTGFYSERVSITASNGFELDKCYTVRVSVTVGGVTGTISYTFVVRRNW